MAKTSADSPKEKKRPKVEQIWFEWKKDPKKEHVDAMLKELDPVIKYRVRELKSGFLDPVTLGQFGRAKALTAINAWDPDLPNASSLRGWTSRHVKRIGEDLHRYQSETQIRAKRPYYVGRILDAQAALNEELGRPPTLEELEADIQDADIDRKQIALTLGELHGGNSGLMTEPDPFGSKRLTPKEVQAMRLVRLDLTPQEKVIWDMRLGINGQKRESSQRVIANAVGTSDATVSRTLRKIQKLVLEASGGDL